MPKNFYFPFLFLTPEFSEDFLVHSCFRLEKRKWETSTFDLATLATKHKLYLPYQVMDVLLNYVNLELCVIGQDTLDQATDLFQQFRLGLYSTGIFPFLCPFITTYSINDYSGINSRDSDYLRNGLPTGLEDGLTSNKGQLEAWHLELSFTCITDNKALSIKPTHFYAAVEKANIWNSIVKSNRPIRIIEEVVIAAPQIISLNQSILQMWSALEGLFPSVSSEVTFRISIYLAQIVCSDNLRLEYFEKIRNAYGLRSKISHGANYIPNLDDWKSTWNIIIDVFNAIVRRGKMPNEKEIITELLS